MAQTPDPILSLNAVSKTYGQVAALDRVDLDLRPGEIHALVGENGAGKSTLLKILTGREHADGGKFRFRGQPMVDADPAGLRRVGIQFVPQELEIFAQQSVCENCFTVSGLPGKRGWVDWSAARQEAAAATSLLHHPLPLSRPASVLKAPERALLQICSSLIGNIQVLALDEPSASLGDTEAAQLFEILEDLRRRDTAILYVSHRLGEVLTLADRVTVLRNGQRVWTRDRADVDEASIVEAMVGRSVQIYFPELAPPTDDVALEVKSLDDRSDAFRAIDFRLRRGEILGVYGVAGSGKTELAQALAGLRRARGQVECGGKSGAVRNPRDARGRGIAYVPGDRLSEGNLSERSVSENLSISSLDRLGSFLWMDRRRERQRAESVRDRFDIACAGLEVDIDTLSGGNQQKVLLGRALATEPDVLILDEPTRGIDVGARAEIHRVLADLAADGKAILLVSSDLPEILGMCHRIAIVRDGEGVGEFEPGKLGEEEFTRLALPRSKLASAAQAAKAETVSTTSTRSGLLETLRDWWVREIILGLAILTIVGITALPFPEFLSTSSLGQLLAAAAPLAVAAAGMSLVISSGAIDLSVGSVLALSASAWALWTRDAGSVWIGILLAMSAGALLGCVNASLVTFARVPAIVATLGMMGVLRGVFLLWSGGEWIELSREVRDLAQLGPLGVPWTAWLAMMFLLGIAALGKCRLEGRELLALGDNPGAARTHGIRARRVRFVTFAILGAAMGLAAVLHTARYGNLQNNTGAGFELHVIAAAVIGGTSISGGRGNVVGAGLGALFLALLAEVRAIWGIADQWQLMAIGALMLIVIGIDRGLQQWMGEET